MFIDFYEICFPFHLSYIHRRKSIPRTQNIRYTMRIIHTFLFVFLFFLGGQIQSQALIDQLRISGNWALMGDFFVDEEGNYIYVQTTLAEEGDFPNRVYTEGGLTVGNKQLDRAAGIEAGSFTSFTQTMVDVFILKISPEFELIDYQVISKGTIYRA